MHRHRAATLVDNAGGVRDLESAHRASGPASNDVRHIALSGSAQPTTAPSAVAKAVHADGDLAGECLSKTSGATRAMLSTAFLKRTLSCNVASYDLYRRRVPDKLTHKASPAQAGTRGYRENSERSRSCKGCCGPAGEDLEAAVPDKEFNSLPLLRRERDIERRCIGMVGGSNVQANVAHVGIFAENFQYCLRMGDDGPENSSLAPEIATHVRMLSVTRRHRTAKRTCS